ncbi:hypothetical protein SAMN06295905_3194 [Devosia lucknowensis]|uniref:Uncharacterized protein n=1 Tax=Devosia lucknowensis TaxID=1096929 RepID=A0A1Y6GCV1_9HYPH|nr:hypothetical protein [Devosia lucknowensis]SMQ85899.1 hypothetical protein SAMN06295905_3194 [Devosia lucknowensis]
MTSDQGADQLDRLVAEIRSRIRQLRRSSLERVWRVIESGEWASIDNDMPSDIERPPDRTLSRLLDQLDGLATDPSIDDEIAERYHAGDWALDAEYQVMRPRKILRGYAVPVRLMPIRTPVTLRAFAFITVDDDSFLDRHLFQGIHYHYCLADKRHTTTMVCWDTRWVSPLAKNAPKEVRPLFHELHAEGAKSVRARPERWNDEKRQSIRNACAPDLGTYAISDFRCASNDAEPVWPRTARLTPRMPSTSAPKKRKSR